MGKKHRERINTNGGEDPEQGRFRAWLGRQKAKARNKIDDALDNATAQAHRKYYKRWMELSYCHTPNLIKWDDPQISLEAKLCDPRNLRLIRKGRHREEFLAILTDEEKDLYLNFVGSDGIRYTDLEDPHILRDTIKGAREQWREAKRKKGEDLTAEEEQALNALLEDESDE